MLKYFFVFDPYTFLLCHIVGHKYGKFFIYPYFLVFKYLKYVFLKIEIVKKILIESPQFSHKSQFPACLKACSSRTRVNVTCISLLIFLLFCKTLFCPYSLSLSLTSVIITSWCPPVQFKHRQHRQGYGQQGLLLWWIETQCLAGDQNLTLRRIDRGLCFIRVWRT